MPSSWASAGRRLTRGSIELLNERPPGLRSARATFRCPACGDAVLGADRCVHYAGDRYHARCAHRLLDDGR